MQPPQIPGQWIPTPSSRLVSEFHRPGFKSRPGSLAAVWVCEVGCGGPCPTSKPGSGGLSQNLFIVACPSLPAGPAESLFKESYYQLMKTALKEDGILCCQGEHRQRGGAGQGAPAVQVLMLPPPRRVPVAAPGPHQGHAALLQVALPRGGLCLLYHPHLPQRPDRLHAVQQKPSELRAVLGLGGRWARRALP